MSHHPVPLNELSAAVQSAVQQVLGEKGFTTVDKLWFGFVAPDQFITEANAEAIAKKLGAGAGASGEIKASMGQTGAAPHAGAQAAAKPELLKPVRIIGLIYEPELARK